MNKRKKTLIRKVQKKIALIDNFDDLKEIFNKGFLYTVARDDLGLTFREIGSMFDTDFSSAHKTYLKGKKKEK